MWKRIRDLFGSGVGLRGELARIRRRVETLESIPSLDARVDGALTRVASIAEIQDGFDIRIVTIEGELDELSDGRKDMILAISDGIERTDRAERRVKNTIRRARKELESRGYADPGLDAEAHEFRALDVEGSDDGGLQLLPGQVEPAAPETSSIRGVPVETLRRARGF